MRVGFTGTRYGMTERQKQLLRDKLLELMPDEIHHGDCVGADEQCHKIAHELKIKVLIHPPIDSFNRAFCESPYMFEPKPYLDRNKDIACLSDVLIGCPDNRTISGTRYTLNYAERMGKTTIIILP